jgi:para-aminobenzoate synthetase/4-amino-4-deoxychorismate lyase
VTTSFQPRVRFDDTRANTTTTLSGFVNELRADHLDEVTRVLEGAEEAARQGSWVGGYVSYEAAPAFDRGLRVHDRDADRARRLPLAWFGVYRECVGSPLSLPRDAERSRSTWELESSEEDYRKGVALILDEIRRGNVYQVNLTSTFVNRGPVDHRALYRQLLVAQRPAYGALIELDGASIVSASPELFIDWDGARLRSRPMKGTIRRGRYEEEDEELARLLRCSSKDAAENVMIVDLIRNDLGRVAVTGSVAVTELQTLEAYPNVWQLVSEVQCATRPGTGLADIFRAMFPCGSVTGAPKQSAMGAIERLETLDRGVYCGAIGLLRPSETAPHARFNVAIRTAVIDHVGGEVRFGSGGGIVADSDPEREYEEMVVKASMLRASCARPFRLLETFRYSPGDANGHIARHLDRLKRSADFFGYRSPRALDALVAAKLASIGDEARVRLLLSRAGRLEFQSAPMPARRETPVRLAVDDEPVDSSSVMLFHKTTQRDLYVARRRRFPDADDVVLVNERAECTESTIANIAARFGENWRTPPLSSGCLPGIERGRLLDDGTLTEGVLRPADLRVADELAVFNSLRGWQRAELYGAPAAPGRDGP